MNWAAVGSGDAGDDIKDGGAAEGFVEVGLDCFFVMDDEGEWNARGEVVVAEVNSVEVCKVG